VSELNKQDNVLTGELKMKKVAASLLCLFVFGTFALAQSDIIIRPRIVPSPSPSRTITTGQTDSSTQNSNKRPPVINGNSGQSSDIKDNRTTSPHPVLTDGNSKRLTKAPPQNEQSVTEEEDGEIIKVETNLVTLPVSVLDRDGRFISGLEQGDFQILDNGVQQKVEYFQSVESPFTVILLIDVSPSTQYHIDEIHEAAIGFVNQLRPKDKVMVISFDENVHVLSPVTNDRKVLEEAILQAEFGGGTSLFEAVDFVINRELKQIEGRKAVVLFTDGVDTTSYRASYQTTVRDAEETDALIYPIRYDTYQPPPQQTQQQQTQTQPQQQQQGGGSNSRTSVTIGGRNVLLGPATREEYEIGRRYLEELARNSGGRTLEALNNLSGAFSNIAEELRRQYSIGYYPEKTGQKGERRQIRVRVMRQNVVVRTKSGYVVGAENKNLKGK
jgi:VWFA-related protein